MPVFWVIHVSNSTHHSNCRGWYACVLGDTCESVIRHTTQTAEGGMPVFWVIHVSL